MAAIPREQYEEMFGGDFPIGYDQYAAAVKAKQDEAASGGGYGPQDWLPYKEAVAGLNVQSAAKIAFAQQVPKYQAKKQIGSGWEFFDNNGGAITLAQYAGATGKTMESYLGTSENPRDAFLFDQLKLAKQGKISWGDLQKKYPWVFGGV
jgi:hypothetical protein